MACACVCGMRLKALRRSSSQARASRMGGKKKGRADDRNNSSIHVIVNNVKQQQQQQQKKYIKINKAQCLFIKYVHHHQNHICLCVHRIQYGDSKYLYHLYIYCCCWLLLSFFFFLHDSIVFDSRVRRTVPYAFEMEKGESVSIPSPHRSAVEGEGLALADSTEKALNADCFAACVCVCVFFRYAR